MLPTITNARDFAKMTREKLRTASSSSTPYLKFSGKTGEWLYGSDETPVDGEEVLIHPHSLQHGWVRWGEKPPAKVMVSVTQDMPPAIESLEGIDERGRPCVHTAQIARAFGGAFMDGSGQFMFETHSMGGLERADELILDICDKAETTGTYLFPRVRLGSDWYKRETGKVYKPVFELVCWCDQNGDPEPAGGKKAIEQKPEQEELPRRRRRV